MHKNCIFKRLRCVYMNMFINVLYIIYIYNILEEKKKRFKYYYFISYICIYHFDFYFLSCLFHFGKKIIWQNYLWNFDKDVNKITQGCWCSLLDSKFGEMVQVAGELIILFQIAGPMVGTIRCDNSRTMFCSSGATEQSDSIWI